MEAAGAAVSRIAVGLSGLFADASYIIMEDIG